MTAKNQLKESQNPYLKQHAHHPVHWMEWGADAFKRAKETDKPIFLSIGYSTCHWCHVMAHECFEDETVAGLMNEAFINIKLDREERPELDALYMSACQMMGQQGGWPLTIIMTPDKRPFFAGTYFPKESNEYRIGLLDLIPKIKEIWDHEREDILTSANQVFYNLVQESIQSSDRVLNPNITTIAYEQLSQHFDPLNGGFHSAPKFPSPHTLLFLSQYHTRTQDPKAMDMVSKTLTHMRLGGIYDHIGFGFHRYSTDSEWKVPHFEKMLYDQALLLWAYAEGYVKTKEPLYRQTLHEIASYCERELKAKNGIFYAAQDADSEGEEGRFYTWKTEELQDSLGETWAAFKSAFNLSPEGNFEEEASRQKNGQNILFVTDKSALSHLEDPLRLSLYEKRKTREAPFLDDKTLTDWNALLIIGFCKAYQATEDKAYLKTAIKTWESLSKAHYKNGEWQHSATQSGFLMDYMSSCVASLALFESTCETEYLERAKTSMEKAILKFWDPKKGGFFMSASDRDDVIIRQKERYDGAIPSGNSMGYYALIRLYQLSENSDFLDRSKALMQSAVSNIENYPSAYGFWLLAEEIRQMPPLLACKK